MIRAVPKARRAAKHAGRKNSRRRRFEHLEDRRLLAVLPAVQLDLHLTDLAGNSLPNNQVAVGDDFLLRGSVQDVTAEPTGAGGLSPGGSADDGEVEDYQHTILDGDAGADAFVELFAGDVEVSAAIGDVLVHRDQFDLFQAPGDAVTGLEFRGTSVDNTVGLGNLSSVFFAGSVPFSFDGGAGTDTLRLTGSDQTLDLRDADNSISNLEEIDIIGASPNELVLDGASVVDVTDVSDTLVVRHDEDDTVSYAGAGWDAQAPIFFSGQQRHVLANGNGRVETINTLPWQNPLIASDTNFSEETTSLDALLIINFIGRSGIPPIPLSTPTSEAELPAQYVDVDGSRTATALDSLLIINLLGQENKTSENELIVSAQPPTLTALPEFDQFEQTDGVLHQLALRLDGAIGEFRSPIGNLAPPWLPGDELNGVIDRLARDAQSKLQSFAESPLPELAESKLQSFAESRLPELAQSKLRFFAR